MSRIRIGQIGIGHNHGEAKMLAVRKFPDLFEVVGYAEENPAWLDKRGGARGYEGLPRLTVDELLDRCDAVLVETDVWNLTKAARQCIERGKHIHMDKPASGTPGEFQALLDTAERKGLVVQMGYMYRYNPAVVKCLEHIRNGDLGEILSIRAEMSTYHSAPYRKWLTNFNGGVMYILGSHLVDLAVYLLGKPLRVHSFLKRSQFEGIDLADNNLAVLEYEKALVRIFVSSVEVNGWGHRCFVVSGTRGSVNIEPLENTCVMTYADTQIAKNPYEDEKIDEGVKDIPKNCRYDTMMQDFHDYITGKAKNPFTYHHDALVHNVISEIVGGVNMLGTDIG